MGSVERHQPMTGHGGALPPWSAAPDNVIPGAVALDAVMAASSKAVVLVSVLWACPVGFWYGLSIRLREPQPHGIPEIGPFFQPRSRGLESGSVMYGAGEQFHFTVAFADGNGNDLTLAEEVASDIQDQLFDILSAHHQGWENNEGGYGEIALDLDDGVPTLDWSHYDYVVDTNLTSHEF